MRKLLMMATAAAAMSTAGVANAQYSGQYGYPGQYGAYSGSSDWNYRRNNYGMFEQQYRHVLEGIRHGLSDGSYSRWQANGFYQELESIRRAAYIGQRYGSYQDGFIQARMARLHQRMHLAHDQGHERNDGYNYGGYQPGYGGYYGGDHNDGDVQDDDD